jgi:hypothetical protein
MSSKEEEEELIRLNDIFDTLKKDAREVSGLLVNGIEYFKLAAIAFIAVGVFAAYVVIQSSGSGITFANAMNAFLAVLCFPVTVYLFYKYRKLKKKYKELIEIHKSLNKE